MSEEWLIAIATLILTALGAFIMHYLKRVDKKLEMHDNAIIDLSELKVKVDYLEKELLRQEQKESQDRHELLDIAMHNRSELVYMEHELGMNRRARDVSDPAPYDRPHRDSDRR